MKLRIVFVTIIFSLIFSCSRLPRNEDVYLAESRLIQIVSSMGPCQVLYFENGMIVEMNLETRYAIGEVYKIYKVNLPAPQWVIKKSGIIK